MNTKEKKLHDELVDKLQSITAMEGNTIHGWFGETIDALMNGQVINNLYIDGRWPALKLVDGELTEVNEKPTFNGSDDWTLTEASNQVVLSADEYIAELKQDLIGVNEELETAQGKRKRSLKRWKKRLEDEIKKETLIEKIIH